MESISFEHDITDLEKQLEAKREELRELEAQWQQYDLEFDGLHAALDALRSATTALTSARPDSLKVEVNPDSGRPARGARREQLLAICRRLGRGQKTFHTVDVLDRLRAIQGNEVTAGLRSYTYSIMKTFADEGFLQKVGRGEWKLK